jgi:hypothetical protein
VSELPVAVGPKLSPVQLVNMSALLVKSGVKDPPKALDEVLKLLGHETSPIIQPTTSLEYKGRLDA